jgi:TonB family protein
MNRHARRFTLLLALLLPLAFAAAPAAAEDGAVDTHFALLSGQGGDDTGANGAVVVPGMVIPIDAGPQRLSGMPDHAKELADLSGKLSRSLRLGEVEVLYTFPVRSVVGEESELPPPSATSSVRVTAKLRGYNEKLATYEVRFRDGSKLFADSVVSVERGKRTVVGAVHEGSTPYLFLVIAPSSGKAGPRWVGGDVTPPRRVYGPSPAYTPEAKEARIQGVVIVQAVIDAEGSVRELTVLKGLPLGLSEAAAEAIRGWEFEPARDGDGNPVEVYYNLTVNFRLDPNPPLAVKPESNRG